MRELVIFGFSSILTPPNSSASHHHHHHHHHHPKPYKSPLRKSTTTATKLLSLPPPSSPPISTVPPYSPLLSNVRWDLTSRHKSHLKYYADLASKLAEDGRIQDFVLIAESVIVSGVQAWQFVAALSLETVKKGFARCLCEEKVWTVVEVLRNVQKLGIPPSELIDKCNKELLGRECCRIVNSGPIEELVELMEILAGLHFAVKELVEPADIVRVCVANHNPNIAIRYACILPHTHVLFSTIIYEFGKKRDLVSALTVYEASKQKMSAPNMYVYRTIIDVCGLCGDYMKSRYIYEDLLSQKVTPNIYVYNSLMNVNSHDLSYAFHVYKDMQNSGVMADMASYNILLKVCCLAGRVDLARDIYRDVQHLESTGVLSLDLFTYTTIIKVFADAKLWQMARRVKDDMLSAGVTPNTIAWSSLISACANAGLVEQTIQLFEDMLLAGCEPNSQCCNILLHACVEARQYDRAFRLFQSWKRSKVQDDYRDNIKGSLAEGNANKQCNTISSNDASNPYYLSFAKKFPFTPTTTTYNILMKACGSDYYRARALIDEMKTIGLSPNHISWSILINICGGSRNSEGALQCRF